MNGEDIVIYTILTILTFITIGGMILNIIDFLRPSNQNKRRRNKMTSDEITNASSGQIADMLTEYNNWRRGKPPYDEPCSLNLSAYELGLCIDRAIEILRGESLNTKSPENGNNEKVVYNGAKMVEVLKSAGERLRKATESEKFGDDVLYLVGCMRSVAQECDYALAEPPRNCDLVKNFYDAQIRFLNETGRLAIRGGMCDWLLANAKGDNNGSK